MKSSVQNDAGVPARGRRIGILWRAAEIFLAALFLLLLSQAHSAIVKTGLSLASLRTDAPAIRSASFPRDVGAGSDTHCVTDVVMRSSWLDKPVGRVPVCGAVGRLRLTIPSGLPVIVGVNGVEAARVQDVGPTTNVTVNLRPGENAISVLPIDQAIQIGDSGPGRSWRVTRQGDVPIIRPNSGMEVTLPWNLEGKMVTSWVAGNGHLLELYQGQPGQSLAENQYRRDRLGSDGFAIIDTGQAPGVDFSPPSWAIEGVSSQARPPFPLSRHVVVKRLPEGGLSVLGNACLPPGSALLQWIEAGQIQPDELLQRLTGLEVLGRRAAPLINPRVETGEDRGVCHQAHFGFEVRKGYIQTYDPSPSFLRGPDDSLSLKGLENTVTTQSPAGTAIDNGAWASRIATSGNAGEMKVSTRTDSGFVRTASAQDRSATADQSAPVASLMISGALNGALRQLPDWAQAGLIGLSTALPIALALWAMQRHLPQAPDLSDARRRNAALTALLALWVAVAAQPLLSTASSWILQGLDIGVFFEDLRDGYGIRAPSVYAPLALAAAFLIVPMLQAYSADAIVTPRPRLRGLAAGLSVLLLLVAFLTLASQRALWPIGKESDHHELFDKFARSGIVEDPETIWLITTGWFIAGLLFLWAPVYWLYRAALHRGRLFWASVGAAYVIFYLPLVAYLVEAGRLLFSPMAPSSDFELVSMRWGLLPGLAGTLIVMVLVWVLLSAFRAVALATLDEGPRTQTAAWIPPGAVLLLSLLLALPQMREMAGDPALAGSAMVTFLAAFQQLGLLLALLAPATALSAIDHERARRGNDRFALSSSELDLIAAAFAGYLTLWSSNPLSLMVTAVTAWFIFRRTIIGRAREATEPEETLAVRLLAYREAWRLQQNRRQAIEDQYSKGAIDLATLGAEQVQLDKTARDLREALGMDADVAKRRLLGNGPGKTPMANGRRGAVLGFGFATLLLIAPSLFGSAPQTGDKGWRTLSQALLTDPAYTPMRVTRTVYAQDVAVPQLLELAIQIANAYLLWVVLGFLFGFTFQLIRGSDGFSKSIRFSFGIGAVLLTSSLIAGTSGPLGGLGRLAPVITFLILAGVVGFDARTVQKAGSSALQLPTLYGVRASVGYVSLAGLIATAQPLLQFVGGLLSKARS